VAAGLLAVAGGAPVGGGGFEVGFADATGQARREELAAVAGAAFEDASPVRSFPSFKGQRNSPGLWWAATMGRHVGF
jgi:hypothetical protein